MKNLFINFIIAVMIFSGISLVHAQESPGGEISGEDLGWPDWAVDKWRALTPDEVDEFFSTPEKITTPDKWGVNPLLYASAYSSEDIFNEFINNRANVHQKFKNGWTALGAAIIAGNDDVVSVLIDNQVNLDQQFGEGWMPLIAGIARGYEFGVAELLKAGANRDVLQQFDFLNDVDISQDSDDTYTTSAESLVNAWNKKKSEQDDAIVNKDDSTGN